VAIPRSGGQYNFSRRAISEYAGFVVGWSDWLSSCGTLAAVSIVVGEYSQILLPALSGRERELAVTVIVLFSLLQWRGIKWGSSIQVVTAALKTIAFVVVAAACFYVGHGAGAPGFSTGSLELKPSWVLLSAMMLGLQAVFYTIDGWHGVIYFSEELKDPAEDVPRSIFSSVFAIVVIYVLLNAAVLYVMPMNEIAGNKFALGTAAEHVFGPHGDQIVRAIMIVSLLSCINAVQLFCSRILYAMSIDGLFFHSASRVNRGGTPEIALMLSTLVGIIFVMGSFERVIAMLSFFFVANYSLSYLSLFLLRLREPELPRPYRAWGYPWTTGVTLAISLLFLGGSLFTDHENAPLALLMLVLSYPVYRIAKWCRMR